MEWLSKKFLITLRKYYYEHCNNKLVTIKILRYYSFKKKCRKKTLWWFLVSALTEMYIIQKGEKTNQKINKQIKTKQKPIPNLPLLAATMSIIRNQVYKQ